MSENENKNDKSKIMFDVDNSGNNISPIDLATLTLLTNVNCRARIETIGLQNIKNHHKAQMKQDVRFYRKRIISAFKDLILRKSNEAVSEKTKHAFDVFVSTLIDDFKVLDTTDIVQSGLNDVDDNGDNDTNNDIVDNDEEKSMKETDMIVNEANDLLKNIKVVPVTMDKYVIKTPLDKKYARVTPSKQMYEQPTPVVQVNLREPALRTKGIRKSTKENMDKDYDEDKETKNERRKKSQKEKK